MLAGCGGKDETAAPPRTVVAMPAQSDHSAPRLSVPGRIDARYTTPLSFRVSGKIIERKVRLGDMVTAGQTVARLDPSETAKNAARAKSQLTAAQHQLDYARQQLTRDRAQAREQLIAASQLEQSQNTYAAALAQRDSAAQQAALAADQLNYTTLVADHAGVITAEQADTGQNVSAGQAVYSLAWSGDIDAVADIPESLLARLKVGQQAIVTLPAAPGEAFDATVRELAPAADPQRRTFHIKLTVQGAEHARLGMTANIAFDTMSGPDTTFTLPATALFHDGPAPAVWVVKPSDNVLELRRVEIARYTDRHVVLSAGIKAGERVVWQGVHTVSAGQKVKPVAPLHPEDFAS
ncbi:efflux RND transporter periplasmic adaptor subunit [Bordetella tumbae]|uniref:efflux RND transporter periplasmic adaptor subunit n=1 Tax=Bordetella tumbae TaxID=1649139 RepID=UPI0039EFC6E4